ncbi:MAG: bifunctional precorrin-2 dehydrogenase/sirohydrochlorin ferrochelatase [Chloroflexota bacterium]|nr:bifunctional precorrin-2 dehydrogenase/sirohydrochlorin ferrochelatase [Chloroflexota bacterium]
MTSAQADEQSSAAQTHEYQALETAYPITLTNLRGALMVLVGGGAVGTRKLRGLLAVGAAVRLISPAVTPELRALADSGAITWHTRAYQPGDLAGARLVFAATNQRAVNAQVADDAAALGLWCNVADDPRAGDFHLPAVYREPGLLVAVSTAGANPARAKRLRDQIANWLAAIRSAQTEL